MIEYALAVGLVAMVALVSVAIVGRATRSAVCRTSGGLGVVAAPSTATVVYGQSRSFTSAVAPNPPSADSLNRPMGTVYDSNGGLYVADTGNNRVLYYAPGSISPSRVYGQGGSMITNNYQTTNGVNKDSLSWPQGMSLDSAGNLYVADANNNRVLYYPAGLTSATRVYGQLGSMTTSAFFHGSVADANGMFGPSDVAVDGNNTVYIADALGNRVLSFTSGSTTASGVYGQGGSPATTVNPDPPTRGSLTLPSSVDVDGGGNLYIGDLNNHRVLFFPYGATLPSRVYGQGGSFTTRNSPAPPTSDSLNQPIGISLDPAGNLYVVDATNQRILFFPAVAPTATVSPSPTVVYGQSGFTTYVANQGGISAKTLNIPEFISVSGTGSLSVGDSANHRVLSYTC